MNEDGLKNVYAYFEDPHMAEYLQSTRIPVKDVKEKLQTMKCEVDKLQGIFRNQKDKEEALEELNTFLASLSQQQWIIIWRLIKKEQTKDLVFCS